VGSTNDELRKVGEGGEWVVKQKNKGQKDEWEPEGEKGGEVVGRYLDARVWKEKSDGNQQRCNDEGKKPGLITMAKE